MDKKEFRIGNIVAYCGDFVEITSLGEAGLTASKNGIVVNCIYDAVHLHPVQITEEILLNSGFEKIVSKYPIPSGSVSFEREDMSLDQFEDDYYFSVEDEISKNSQSKTIKHLHKLQNLYFELKDKELEIKL